MTLPSELLRETPDEQRPSDRRELVEPADELEVVRNRLAEADPRVEADELLRHARGDRERKPLLEKALHVRHHVVVRGVDLHRARLALHVHEAEIAARVGDDACELGIASESRHVVDELDAELERTTGNRRLGRVDRDRGARQVEQHLLDPLELLVGAHAHRAGPRRLAADVDDRGAAVEHAPGCGHRRLDPEVHSTVRERVGRDVDHAHHRWGGKPLVDRHASV